MLLLLNNIIVFAAFCKKHILCKTSHIIYLLLSLFMMNSASAGLLEKSVAEQSKFEANDLYKALSAEIYNKLGEQDLAVDFYYELSAYNSDPAIAKRITELATVAGQMSKALDGAERWVVLAPKNLEANQYLALLLLRNSHFGKAAQQLDSIRSLIEKTSIDKAIVQADDTKKVFHSSESIMFVGAMLTSEAHHEKALTTFELFIKNHYSKRKDYPLYLKQIQLITAELAMKSKKYSVVIDQLESLTGLDAGNHIDAKVLLAKALNKLGKNKQAIKQLELIQDHPEVNDSHRLELVRLLVLDKQKTAALPILEALVSKHSKNLELLKSLIALQLDLSELSKVDQNIKLLNTKDIYENDVNYFTAEFAEKLGQREKALLHFAKVEKGSYLKNAHKKTIHLTKLIHGQEKLHAFFVNQQKNTDSIKDQAYWIKLQADEFLESQQYDNALSLYNKAITLAPKQSRYRYKRGLVNERVGNFEKAELDFNHVLATRENDVDTLNALGYMLSVHTKRLEEARTYINKAFKLKPNDPLVLDSLGFVLYKSGELDKAEQYLRKAFRLMKKPEVASHLITVLAKLNQHQEAKNIYLQMQKIYPNSPSLKSVLHFLR